jgi:hypothetical protein
MGTKLWETNREALLAELKYAYEEGGLTIKELAVLYGVSYSTMHFRLTAAGVNMRPRNDQPAIGAPQVAVISIPCSRCGAAAGTPCVNVYRNRINDFHVARRRAAAGGVDNACET